MVRKFNREAESEIRMMKNAESWPLWPWLPVKKRSETPGQWPTMGVMVDSGSLSQPEVKPVIYDTSFDQLAIGQKQPDKVLATYDSIESLVEDGWVVD